MRALLFLIVASACASSPHPFPLRDPFTVDTDKTPVSVACRSTPDKDDPKQETCAPVEYVSPFIWDQIDNMLFARLSRGFAIETTGEARNANSFDEVADSAWFTNDTDLAVHDDGAAGACKPEDILPGPDEVKDGEWTIDHGKDNGSTLGFRVDVPGKGRYMLKADDTGKPERASAASVIGAALYDALGYNTTCEQVVTVKKSMLKLKEGLKVFDNEGISRPFDDEALDKVLASSTPLGGGLVRLQASKWLPGLAIGPFRYVGTRADDPNDVINHSDRRELRGNRILSAWLDHWDAREQNSMDVWFSVDEKNKRASPGYVKHYIIDTSDTMGGEVGLDELSRRLGHAYEFDAVDILRAIVTFGGDERPWDRARYQPGKEKFAYYSTRDFDPGAWRPFYPNPAFFRMTERDAAWMARKIARFSPELIRKFVDLGKWKNPADAEYLTNILVERQRRILSRYLSKLSPLGEVHVEGDKICATDFARLRGIAPAATFHYSVVEHRAHDRVPLDALPGDNGVVCFTTHSRAPAGAADADPARRVTYDVRDGTSAGPLLIHAYDLGPKGMKVVGLTRKD
ncbi:MAG: hypothetical protein ABI678_08415 [Kofleriaceae bacterium]